MHKQVVIIGAGPSGLLLARMLFNRNIDCVILENRNEPFLGRKNRGGFIEKSITDILISEQAATLASAVPLNSINFNIFGKPIQLSLPEDGAVIYDQINLAKDLLNGLISDNVPIIFEAKGQRYEGLDSDQVKVIYTLHGQLYDMTCDYVIGCDGYTGISRRTIPRSLRKETVDNLPYAWLEWIVDRLPESNTPLIAYHIDGFAMQVITANSQTRYYMQVDRGIEMDDLPVQDAIWSDIEKRLGCTIQRGAMLNLKLDYMRSFSTDMMQYERLFIAGDAAHQVPRLGSKGLNMALSDATILAEALSDHYNNDDLQKLNNYTQTCLDKNMAKLEYSNELNKLFHNRNADEQVSIANQIIQTLTTDKQTLIDYLIG